MILKSLLLLGGVNATNPHIEDDVPAEPLDQQVSNIPMHFFADMNDYVLILAFAALFVAGFIYKYKKRPSLPKHPFKVYQDADRHAANSLKKGEVAQALLHYERALTQVAPPMIPIENDSSRKQVAWILHKKIEELHELEEK